MRRNTVRWVTGAPGILNRRLSVLFAVDRIVARLHRVRVQRRLADVSLRIAVGAGLAARRGPVESW